MEQEHPPTVYSIPAGISFADSFAAGLLARHPDDPLALAAYTVLMPSRRACRTVREAFLRQTGGKPALLPRLYPIGDIDADAVTLLLSAVDDAAATLDMPPAVSRLERQMLLARLISKSAEARARDQSFDQAVVLAHALGEFIDEVETEGLDFAKLETLVPEKFSAHWQETLDFLGIIREHWPKILSTRGAVDYAARRNSLLNLQAEAWEKFSPSAPVIAVGDPLSASVPAAARLLSLVARLPQGMLVLPGLDTWMDEASWQAIEEDHPQRSFRNLLERIPCLRSAVKIWPTCDGVDLNGARGRLLSEAMRPAVTTDAWRRLTSSDIPPEALAGMSRIDCATPQEEAEVIALLMRETLEAPARTAALVTPDRKLARRVSVALRRWGIIVDDSGGQPLTELPCGAFLMHVAEAAAADLAPVRLLSVLKHPFMAAEIPADEMRDMVSLLDRAVLRGPRPSPGFDGLQDAIVTPDKLLPEAALRLTQWLARVEAAVGDFSRMMAASDGQEYGFSDLIRAHIAACEKLAATAKETGAARLWAGDAGEAAAKVLSDLAQVAADIPPLPPRQYVSIISMLLKSATVRPRYGVHPRLFILGQIEARLYAADRVILGGLNEGTWPALPAHDPWMSRPMRRDFGLPPPERAIGIAAHDFVQAASSPEVVLTRARKVDGTPTVPARWLFRLDAVLAATGRFWDLSPADKYRHWVAEMDRPDEVKPVSRPAPTPPVAARPTELSVTRIETLMRDPYQIYAEKILRLKKLDSIDADAGASERGTFVHKALENFVRAYPREIPDNARDILQEMGRAEIAQARIPQEVEAFWWPRFERIVDLFIAHERRWRQEAIPFRTEIKGSFALDTEFTLTAKADRIDKMRDGGGYAVIDYKTGTAPGPGDVAAGLSPQLPLEAMMLEKGAFPDVPPAETLVLEYWQMTGSGGTPFKLMPAVKKPEDARVVIDHAEEGLRALIDTFRDPETPYLSQPRGGKKAVYSDYAHLARVKEWSVSGDDDVAEDAA